MLVRLRQTDLGFFHGRGIAASAGCQDTTVLRVAIRRRDFGSQPGFAGSVVDEATMRFFAQAILHYHWGPLQQGRNIVILSFADLCLYY
jgi:hypothetical protein